MTKPNPNQIETNYGETSQTWIKRHFPTFLNAYNSLKQKSTEPETILKPKLHSKELPLEILEIDQKFNQIQETLNEMLKLVRSGKIIFLDEN